MTGARRRARRAAGALHRALGLAAGALFALIGVTGAVLVFYLEAGAALSDGETDGGAAIDDIAAPNGWVTLCRSFGKAFAFGRVFTALEQDEPGPTELARPGYTIFDLGGGWRFSEALELRLLVRNAGDRRYFAAADNAADRAVGRSISLALSGRI